MLATNETKRSTSLYGQYSNFLTSPHNLKKKKKIQYFPYKLIAVGALGILSFIRLKCTRVIHILCVIEASGYVIVCINTRMKTMV